MRASWATERGYVEAVEMGGGTAWDIGGHVRGDSTQAVILFIYLPTIRNEEPCSPSASAMCLYLVRGRVQARGCACDQGHTRAVAREAVCDCAAKAGGSAGHDDGPRHLPSLYLQAPRVR